MATIVSQLVALTSRVAYEDLSQATIAAAKRAILDALGCGIAALGCEPSKIAARAMPNGPCGDATVIGDKDLSFTHRAVLLNGILVRYLDMMDVYWAKDVCHPAENVPAALACVESVEGSGRRLIEAVVAGYEAQLRLTHAMSLQQMAMHHVAAGGIVAPLVVGKAWGMDPEAIEHAVALAGCRQFTLHGLSKGGLSMAKAIGYAWSAMSSVMASRLASEGFTGPTDFLDWLSDKSVLKLPIDRKALEHDGTYLIERVSFKQFPVQFELQTTGEIAIRLSKKIRDSGSTIESVEIDVAPVTIERTADAAKFKPANRETADHSLPASVAMALLDGKLTAAQFEHDRWADADVAALIAKITVIPNSEYPTKYPKGRPAGFRVKLANGETLADFQAVPSGDAEKPMDDATLEAKFVANASEAFGEARAREIVEAVREVERIERLGELTRLLRP
ncbi:MAG TPA: MmgE/PrpD family protein [Burkholderiales bacterium]|nr:MmgE/PrpD family protein [Burkholderiales bacterium]